MAHKQVFCSLCEEPLSQEEIELSQDEAEPWSNPCVKCMLNPDNDSEYAECPPVDVSLYCQKCGYIKVEPPYCQCKKGD